MQIQAKLSYKVILALFSALAIISCNGKGEDPGQFIDIDPQGWVYGDYIEFQLPADTDFVHENAPDESNLPDNDTISHRPANSSTLELTVRHTDAYEFANLWIEISYPTGDTIARDSFDIVLADRFGRWNGNGMGLSFQTTKTLETRHKLKDASKLRIRHIMRIDTLRNIEQLGLKIIKR